MYLCRCDLRIVIFNNRKN